MDCISFNFCVDSGRNHFLYFFMHVLEKVTNFWIYMGIFWIKSMPKFFKCGFVMVFVLYFKLKHFFAVGGNWFNLAKSNYLFIYFFVTDQLTN